MWERRIRVKKDNYELTYEVLTDKVDIKWNDKSWEKFEVKELVEKTFKDEKERELIHLKNEIYYIVKKRGILEKEIVFKEFYDHDDNSRHLKDVFRLSFNTPITS